MCILVVTRTESILKCYWFCFLNMMVFDPYCYYYYGYDYYYYYYCITASGGNKRLLYLFNNNCVLTEAGL